MSPDGGRVAFQLERFELSGDDRLEVAGRWFGVRGLRFVRPSLTVHTDEGERSLLALLEHKPWAVEEGHAWVAAFPWEGASPDPDQAELAVAPSVVVTLTERATGNADTGATAAAPRRETLRDRLGASDEKVRRLEAEVAFLRQERESLVDEANAGEIEREGAAAALAAAERERDDALREQERIAAQRDEALAKRNEARAERDAALRERDETLRARDSALADNADSETVRKKAAREREAALRERDRLAAELDEARESRNAAELARDEAIRERDSALGRGTGFPAVSPERPTPANQDWMVRGIALAATITFLLLVLVFLKPL